MTVLRRGVAAILALVGVVWVGQGVGIIPGSFMTSDLRWAVAGTALIVVAIALVWWSRDRSGR